MVCGYNLVVMEERVVDLEKVRGVVEEENVFGGVEVEEG